MEEVASRPLRVKSHKAGNDILQEQTHLSWQSVHLYVTAITDLYREQKALGMNNHPTPHEDNVRQYLKSLQQRDAWRDWEQFADKGRDTLLNEYNEDEFEKISLQSAFFIFLRSKLYHLYFYFVFVRSKLYCLYFYFVFVVRSKLYCLHFYSILFYFQVFLLLIEEGLP